MDKKRFSQLLLLVLFISYPAFCVCSEELSPIVIQEDKIYYGKILENSKKVTIDEKNWFLHIGLSAWHYFTPTESGEFIIEAESNDDEFHMAILGPEKKPISVAIKHDKFPFRKGIKHQLEKNIKYVVIVGTNESAPLKYRLNITREKQKQLCFDNSISTYPVDLIDATTVKYENLNELFLGHKAIYLKIDNIKNMKPWFRVNARSEKIHPYLVILNDKGEIIRRSDNAKRTDKSAFTTFEWEGKALYVVLAADNIKRDTEVNLKKEKEEQYNIFLNFKNFSYPPDGTIYQKIRSVFSDPFYALIAGILITIIIGYISIKLSKQRRMLKYSIDSSTYFLDEDTAKGGAVQLYCDGVKILNAGVCDFVVSYSGSTNLTNKDILIPLKVSFDNIEKILTIKTSKSEGWGDPIFDKNNDKTAVYLNVNNIDNNDKLRIRVYYEQNELIAPECNVMGRISNGTIKKNKGDIHDKYSTMMILFLFVIFFLVWPSIYIDTKFNIMPSWWPNFVGKIFNVFALLYFFWIILFKDGRRFLFLVIKTPIRLCVNALKWARNSLKKTLRHESESGS